MKATILVSGLWDNGEGYKSKEITFEIAETFKPHKIDIANTLDSIGQTHSVPYGTIIQHITIESQIENWLCENVDFRDKFKDLYIVDDFKVISHDIIQSGTNLPQFKTSSGMVPIGTEYDKLMNLISYAYEGKEDGPKIVTNLMAQYLIIHEGIKHLPYNEQWIILHDSMSASMQAAIVAYENITDIMKGENKNELSE